MPSDLDFTGPLREALLAADFTYDRVAETIGEATSLHAVDTPCSPRWLRERPQASH